MRRNLHNAIEGLNDNVDNIHHSHHSHHSNHKGEDRTTRCPTYFLATPRTLKTRERLLKGTNFHERTPMLHQETECLCNR